MWHHIPFIVFLNVISFFLIWIAVNYIKDNNPFYKFIGTILLLSGLVNYSYCCYQNLIISLLSLCWGIDIYIIFIDNMKLSYKYTTNKMLTISISLMIGSIFALINDLMFIISYENIYILFFLHFLLWLSYPIINWYYKPSFKLELDFSFISSILEKLDKTFILAFFIPIIVLPLMFMIIILIGFGGISPLLLYSFKKEKDKESF